MSGRPAHDAPARSEGPTTASKAPRMAAGPPAATARDGRADGRRAGEPDASGEPAQATSEAKSGVKYDESKAIWNAVEQPDTSVSPSAYWSPWGSERNNNRLVY